MSFAYGNISSLQLTHWNTEDSEYFSFHYPGEVSFRRSFPSSASGLCPEDTEKMLAWCADLFNRDYGPFVAPMCACLECVDLPISSQAVVMCASLEAVIQALRNKKDIESQPTGDERKILEECLANPGLSEPLVNRIRGFLGSMGHERPQDVLKAWSDESVLGVTDEDVNAWKEVRHSVTHGGLLSVDNDTIQAMSRLKNLFNKLILQAAGYSGQYMDYVAWNRIPFPLADPSVL